MTIKQYTIPRTQVHFAGVDIPNNERFVPDWYINVDGPVSKLRAGSIMYSEYANKPLDRDDRFERYYGIPKNMIQITRLKVLADSVRSGVRRLFGMGELPPFDADITAAIESAPPLEIEETISIEKLEPISEVDVEEDEETLYTIFEEVEDEEEDEEEEDVMAKFMELFEEGADFDAAQQGADQKGHKKTTAATLAPGEVPVTMKEGALEQEIDTSKVVSTHKSDAAQQEIDPKGQQDLPPDYAKAVAKFFNNSQYDKEIYKMLTNSLLQNIKVIPKIDEADVKDDIYNRVISKDAMTNPDSVDSAMLYLYDSYKALIKKIDGYTKSMNDLEQQLITDGIIKRDKVNVGQNNAEELQAIHGMGRGTTILFSMLRGEYFPKSNPNIPSYEMAIRDDTQPTDKIEDTTEYKHDKEILSVAAAHAKNTKTLLRSIQGQMSSKEMREAYREYLAESEPNKLKYMQDKDIEIEAKKISESKAGLYFQLADRMLDYLEENPRRGALSVKEYRKKLAEATKKIESKSKVEKPLEGIIDLKRLTREKTKKPLSYK